MRPTQNTVLITGGTSGIGLELARRFHREGNAVIVTGRNPSALGRVRSELPGLIAEQADMADPAALSRLVERYPEVNILVNNAAVQHNYNLADPGRSVELIDEELAINLLGPLRLIKLMLPRLLSKEAAAIINVSSGLAIVPKQSAPVYCASKAALRSFTRSLRWQLEGGPVKVFEIVPALIETPMTAGRGKGRMGKITPAALVDEFWAGFVRDRYELRIGKTKLLYHLQRLAPALAERIMRPGL